LLALKELPDPDITFYKAMIYYQMKDFKRALVEARNVERIAIEQARTVKENWWYLQVVLLNEAKDYKAVIPVLEKLLVHYPSKQYWLQLAGMFVETTQDDKALSAYYAAYSQGMLTREGELVMLAQRLLNAEVPFEAAKVLERGLKAGTVTETDKNMTLLATCYTLSQDMDKAIDAWRNASKLGKDGDKFNRLAQALSQQDRHKEAIDAYRQALDHGVKDPEEIKFWLGISLMQTDQWDAAIEAFRDAAKDKGKEKTARQYIQYITGEQKRQEALKEMMKASAPRESKAG
jgi:tetratricopeptide (TPR) repeat protein